MTEKKNKKEIDRRQFLRTLGISAAGTSAVLMSCAPKRPDTGIVAHAGEVPTDRMTYRTDSKIGNPVSLLGYGCMRWPRRPKDDNWTKEEAIDQEAVNELVDYAIAHGVNYFDTSPVYCQGLSEHATGIALSRHKRSEYLIATKMSNQSCHGREDSIAMYHNSFKELKVDYIDYYLVHSVGTFELFKKRYLDNGILNFMLAEREAGRIRNLGWSFHGEKEFFDYMMNDLDVKWDFVQIQLNYFDWETSQGRSNVSARYQYEVLAEKGIPAIIMEPLLGGRLAQPNHKAQSLMKQANPDASFASWAFRFTGSLPGVLTVLSGMTYMEHLQDNLRSFAPLQPITEKEHEVLKQVSDTMLEFQTINCTGCEYCMPCPYGIDIPNLFAHYNRCQNEGNFPDSAQDENYRKARRAFLVGMDRSVPKLRQANHCTGCGICSQQCPQSIRIPAEMQKIDRFVEELKLNG